MAGSMAVSTAELKRRGTYDSSRHDKRATQAYQKPIEGPPDWLDEEEKAQFVSIVKRKAPGFLSLDDTETLALLCKLHVKLARDSLKAGEIAMLRLLSREFGMTPDSRYRMPGPSDVDVGDALDELKKRREARRAKKAAKEKGSD